MATSYLPRTMAAQMGYLTSTLAGGTLDLLDVPKIDQTIAPPPAFQPFRFERRRARIDWRLLHGVDINNIVSVTGQGLLVHARWKHHVQAGLTPCL
jgi:zinc finger protein DZIP1